MSPVNTVVYVNAFAVERKAVRGVTRNEILATAGPVLQRLRGFINTTMVKRIAPAVGVVAFCDSVVQWSRLSRCLLKKVEGIYGSRVQGHHCGRAVGMSDATVRTIK